MGYQPYGEYFFFRIKGWATVSGIIKVRSDSLSNAQLMIKNLKLGAITEYVDDVQPSKCDCNTCDKHTTTPPKKR